MCDCGCAANCGCNITALTKGEKGDPGADGAAGTVTVVYETTTTEASTIEFVGDGWTVTDAGGGVTEVSYTEDNSILIANTVFVNKYGNDATGLVERFDKPFLTITAAVTAARTAWNDAARGPHARKKIIVESGYYEEDVMWLFPYIDYDFGNSTIVGLFTDHFTAPVTPVTFTANPDNDFTVKIFGNAKFESLTDAYSVNFTLTDTNTRLLCQCDTLHSSVDDCISMVDGYGRFICNEIYNTNTAPGAELSHCIQLAQGAWVVGPWSKSTLDIVGARIFQNGNVSATTIGCWISAGDSTSVCNQTLNLINCIVVNNMGGEEETDNQKFSAIGIATNGFRQPGTVINLYNTTLYSKNGKSVFVEGSALKANVEVNYYMVNCANVGTLNESPDANHTLVENMKTTGLIVDANVVPIIP